MSKASEAGKEFLAGALAKVPAEKRAQVEALLGGPEFEEALVVIGTGALGQSDINRKYDEIKTKDEELDELRAQLQESFDRNQSWWNQNKAALEEYKVIKPEFETLKKGGDVKPPDGNGNTHTETDVRKAIDSALENNNRAFAGALAFTLNLTQRHKDMFGENLDVMELLRDPRLGKQMAGQPEGRVISLEDVYHDKFGKKVEEFNKKKEDERFNAEVEKRFAEKLKANPVPQPFPLRDSSPSPLDALQDQERGKRYTVDSATAEYERLTAIRTGQAT